jgi:hypothetical protein
MLAAASIASCCAEKERSCSLNLTDGDPRGLFATAGAGVSWNFVPQWSVISEVFALIGPGQSNPRFQSGVRYSPSKNIDWDVIYARLRACP